MKKSSVKWAVLAAALAFGLLLGACSNAATTETNSGNIEDLPTVSDLKVQAGDGDNGQNPVVVISWKAENNGSYPVTYALWVKGEEGSKYIFGASRNSRNEKTEKIEIDTREYLIWDDNSGNTYSALDNTSATGTVVDTLSNPSARTTVGSSYYALRNKSAGLIYANYVGNAVGTDARKNSIVLDSGFDKNYENPAGVYAGRFDRLDNANFDPPQNWVVLSPNKNAAAIGYSGTGNHAKISVLLPPLAVTNYPEDDGSTTAVTEPRYQVRYPDVSNPSENDRWYARIDLASLLQAISRVADLDSTHSFSPMDSDYSAIGTRKYKDVNFVYKIGVQTIVNYREDDAATDNPRFFVDPSGVEYAGQTIRVFSLSDATGDGTAPVTGTANSDEHNKNAKDYVAEIKEGHYFYSPGSTTTPHPNAGLVNLGVVIK